MNKASKVESEELFTFINQWAEKHKIFDVVKGKSEANLREYLLSLKGRERVRVVCMDLSSTYRAIVQKYFPNAKIVADRFHVIRLMQHMFLKTCHQLDPEVKYQRGLLKLLRTKTDRLSETQLQKRAAYFARHTAIAAVFEFKEKLYRLLMNKHRKVWQCKKLIPVFLAYVKQLKVSGFQWLKSLGKTLYSWKEAIVCMWRFTRSNGITEGFHRKMKLIQRRAYGFRNFENYRMRVKVLCG
jgi:transposase